MPLLKLRDWLLTFKLHINQILTADRYIASYILTKIDHKWERIYTSYWMVTVFFLSMPMQSDMKRFVLTDLHKMDWIKSCRKRKISLEYIVKRINIGSRSGVYPFVSFSGLFCCLSSWPSQRLFFSAGLCSKTFKQNAPCWQTDRQSTWRQIRIRRKILTFNIWIGICIWDER